MAQVLLFQESVNHKCRLVAGFGLDVSTRGEYYLLLEGCDINFAVRDRGGTELRELAQMVVVATGAFAVPDLAFRDVTGIECPQDPADDFVIGIVVEWHVN